MCDKSLTFLHQSGTSLRLVKLYWMLKCLLAL